MKKSMILEGKKVGNKEELLSLAEQKLDEMQAEVDKTKKGFFNKVFFTKGDIAAAENVIRKTRAMVAGGVLSDLYSVRERVKFAGNVDLTGLPERKGKTYRYLGESLPGQSNSASFDSGGA